MKKFIFLSILLFSIAETTSAQTNYYPDSEGTISKSGYTYRYGSKKGDDGDVNPVILQIYNSDNRYLNVKWGRKDGTVPPSYPYEDGIGSPDEPEHSSASSLTVDQFHSTVNNCFSTQQKALLKGSSIWIECRIDPSTGKVADVYFSFFRNQPARYIPVETYRSVELAIKQKLSFTMTAEGRRMNYTEVLFRHIF